MSTLGWLQIALYLVVLLLLVKPLGAYMARVYEGGPNGLQRVLGPLERWIYRLGGVRPDEDMGWKAYASAALAFNMVGLLAVYVLQRVQGVLPWNPQGFAATSPHLAFNTAVSFASNTNWQAYGGETTLSYLTQMLGLTVQNFVSAATGMAVLVAMIRGLARITFAVMLVVGVIVSHLTHRIRQQADAARRRERRSAALYAMIRDFAVETSVDDIAATAVQQVRDLLETDAVVLMIDADGRLAPRAGLDSPLASSEREIAVARWVYEHGRPAGHDSDTLPAADGLFLPLVGTREPLGVFGVALARCRVPPSPAQRQLFETFTAQTALALERARLSEHATAADVAAETERARSALLSAVSHDLRTPLASITGTAGMLLDDRTALADGARRELLETIRDEADRLSRLIANLLDLTRLDSGALQVRKELCPLEEIVGSALHRLRAQIGGRDVRVALPPEVLLVPVDPVLIEQVFVNLLENALRYSPPGSPLEVTAAVEGDAVAIAVADRGNGIPAGEEEQIFERFYRLADGARSDSTGLGLTICRAIVRAHGGRITAANRAGGGSVFRFTLPLGGAQQVLRELQAEPDAEATS